MYLSFFIFNLITLSTMLFSADQYPQHLAKGDNTKCFPVGDRNKTLLQHLNSAKKAVHAQQYANVFRFYRFKQHSLVTKMSDKIEHVHQLTQSDLQNIINEHYRIQQKKVDRFNIFLTPFDTTVAAYHQSKLEQSFKKEQ